MIAQAKPASDHRFSDDDALAYLLYDGHGSTRGLITPTGVVAATYDYDAYGLLIGDEGLNTATTTLRYAGEQFDAKLAMYYLRARYYDPAAGRFWSFDEYRGNNADPASLHKHLYANGNPIRNIDPSGNFSILENTLTTSIMRGLAALKPLAVSFAYVSMVKSVLNGLLPIPFIDAAEDTESHKSLARLCSDVYANSPRGAGEWLPSITYQHGSLFSQLYKSRTRNAFVLAFRGTDDFGDLYTDGAQALLGAFLPTQYETAVMVARQVQAAIGNAELTLTGHSLGGGLASAAAMAINRPVVTFNAAGVHPGTAIVNGGLAFSSSAVGYSVDGELLTALQRNTAAPGAFGTLYRLRPAVAADPATLHRMASMLAALEIQA